MPSTIPTEDYLLSYSFENAAGDIRESFSGAGTPSVTNGRLALGVQEDKPTAAGQALYFSSSVAGDDINWGTKDMKPLQLKNHSHLLS